MRGRIATASIGVSLALHGLLALRVVLGRPAAIAPAGDHRIEVTTFVSRATTSAAAAPPAEVPASAATTSQRERALRRVPVRTSSASSSAIEVTPKIGPPATEPPSTPPHPVDLFATEALRRAADSPPNDPGGHLRRSTDPKSPTPDEREIVGARVDAMVADGVARERVSSGNVAPRWRDIERTLAQSFHPPLAAVKQESVVKAFAHQVLRSWLDGDPHTGQVPRGIDPSVQTLPGTPEGLNMRSLPMEQALAVQARWAEPATWLRVEVEVTIDEDGRIVSARVTRPSGRRLFDRTALGAVEDAIRAGGAPAEHRTVVTRWQVEAAMAVAPPTAVGFRFDETGHLDPGATGWGKYIGGTYPLQQTVKSHVSLVAIEH